MTGKQIAARLGFHGRASRYQGSVCWMVKCPAHDDKKPSLSITERGGWVCFKCFRSCTRDEILAAMGLKVRDLALGAFNSNPEWEQRRKDSDRLKLLNRRHGLAIMAQAVIPAERNYWAAVERNIAVEIEALRRKLYPDEAAQIHRNETAQHLIAEYGFDELWECLP